MDISKLDICIRFKKWAFRNDRSLGNILFDLLCNHANEALILRRAWAEWIEQKFKDTKEAGKLIKKGTENISTEAKRLQNKLKTFFSNNEGFIDLSLNIFPSAEGYHETIVSLIPIVNKIDKTILIAAGEINASEEEKIKALEMIFEWRWIPSTSGKRITLEDYITQSRICIPHKVYCATSNMSL